MIFYFFISIVFIAEIIITASLLLYLKKLDKVVLEFNSFLNDTKPSIKELLITCKKISEQLTALSPKLIEKIKITITNLLVNQLKSMAGAITFWLVKKEVEKHV